MFLAVDRGFALLEGKMLDHIHPIGGIASLANEFQVLNVSSHQSACLMPVKQPRKGLLEPLPILRQCLEANVLREQDALKARRPLKQGFVRQFTRTIFLRGEHVNALSAQLIANRARYVNIEV